MDLILVKDANTGDFNEINGIIDVCIYLSETKKSYISFKYESTFMVTSRDASIEWPDFSQYVDYTENLFDNVEEEPVVSTEPVVFTEN